MRPVGRGDDGVVPGSRGSEGAGVPGPLGRWAARRRARVRAELDRSEDSRVPTWVLALALAVLVAGWLALVALA